jgi:hypothetical protein
MKLKLSCIMSMVMLSGGCTYATAQTPPKLPFVPWTVTEQDDTAIRTFLQKHPYEIAAPIIGWLDAQESKARQIAADAEKAKAPAAPPKPVPESSK